MRSVDAEQAILQVLAGSMLVTGVILVCKPAFLFPNLSPGTVEKDDLSYLGIFLAVTACIASGLMDVLVAKCVEVSASVLMLWTAIMGLVISIIYCLNTAQSQILSADLLHITWRDWALYFGQFKYQSLRLQLKHHIYCLKVCLSLVCWPSQPSPSPSS